MAYVFTGALVVGAAVSAIACAVAKWKMENVKCRIKESSSLDRKESIHNSPFYILHFKFSIHTAVFVFFAGVAVQYAGAKHGGTNDPPRGGNVELKIENGKLRNFPSLTETEQIHNSTFSIFHSQFSMDDVIRGFLLESVVTNDSYSYAMTTNGVRYDKWWKRGAYEDVFRLDLGGMRFPLKDELLDSFWIYSWGMAGAHLGNASNRLVATGVPMSAVPCLSQFWSADAASGSKLLTWEDFFLNRDTNTPVSAQLELYPNGDFIARSNNVESVYRRINPDDWDDDGIPNDEDDEPLVASEPAFGPQQELPQGANSNAYYWVDIVVLNASARVTFTGDGESSLADPSFIALPGETNRVTLLIGKTYHAESRMPITCVEWSSAEIEVRQESPTSLFVLWPVTIETVQMRDGLSFAMIVIPDCLGGGFTWTNSCCSISSSGGNTFTYSCNDTCHCTGCCALGCYTYENFSLPASGGSCGCSAHSEPDSGNEEEDDDGPYAGGASATFSKSAVIFEDPYENTPGVWIGRHSTTTELHCVAHGGPYGGHVRFEVLGSEKLNSLSASSLPFERDVSPGKRVEFSVIYEGAVPSASADDIIATATFTENVDGAEPEATTNTLTSVKVELTSSTEAVENRVRTRHVYGVAEVVNRRHYPSEVMVTWVLNGVVLNGDSVFSCPPFEQEGGLEVRARGAEYHPLISIVEPSGVLCRTASVDPLSYSAPIGVAGCFAMILDDITLLPLNVSFGRLYVEEVPTEDSTCYGYFDQTHFATNAASHYYGQGAGLWVGVSDDNVLRIRDRVSVGTAPTPWSHGGMIWPIPMGWHTNNVQLGTVPLKCINADIRTVYTMISAEGTIVVSKLSHWISRGTNCVVTLDGEVVNGDQ